MRFLGRVLPFFLLILVLAAAYAYFGSWGFPSQAALNDELRKDFQATARYDRVSGNPIRGFDLQNLHLDSARGLALDSKSTRIVVGLDAILSRNPHPKELSLLGGSLTLKRTKDKTMQVDLPPSDQANFTLRISDFTYNYTDETGPAPLPLTGNLDGALEFRGNVLHFDHLAFGALNAQITVTGDYNRGNDDYNYDVAVSGLSIETLRQLLVGYYGPFTDFGTDAGVDFTANARRQNDVFVVSGQLKSPKAYVRGFHLDTITSEFSYTGGVFKLKNLSAGMYSGKLSLPEATINLLPAVRPENRSTEYTYTLQVHVEDLDPTPALDDLGWLKTSDLKGKLGGEFSLSGTFGGVKGTKGSGYVQATSGDFPSPDGKGRLSYDLIKLEFNYDAGIWDIQHGMLTLKDDRWLAVGKLKVDMESRSINGRGAIAMPVSDALLEALGQKATVESYVKVAAKAKYAVTVNFTAGGMLLGPDISFNTPNQPLIVFTSDATEDKLGQLWDKFSGSTFGRGE